MQERKKRPGEPSGQSTPDPLASTSTRPVYRIGGMVVGDASTSTAPPAKKSGPPILPATATDRTIRFPGEEPPAAVAS